MFFMSCNELVMGFDVEILTGALILIDKAVIIVHTAGCAVVAGFELAFLTVKA